MTDITPEKVREALKGATPGPWKVGNRYSDTSVYSADGETLVANTHGSQRNYRREDQLAEQDANARLIAMTRNLATAYLAAMEEIERMRKRVEEIDRFLSHPLDPDDVICARDEARSALATYRATGEGE